MGEVKLLLNVKEAATALSLSPWTIRKFIKLHKLTPVRLGRRVFVEVAEIHRFIERNRT
jgi:excisionase family DNA binding protein